MIFFYLCPLLLLLFVSVWFGFLFFFFGVCEAGNPGWPLSLDPTEIPSGVLRLQVCFTMTSLLFIC
jgi:hypothetical protein